MNRNAPNAANYDESKANPYPDLPDPLVLKNGEKVTTPEQWWTKRRPEIVEDFDREVYGRVPKDVPKVTWEVTEHDRGEGRRHPGHHQEAGGPRRQFEVPADQGRHPAHADDAGRRQGAGAGDDGVRLRRLRPAAGRARGGSRRRRCPRPATEGAAGFGRRRPVLAAAGPRQGLGLRHHRPQQHPGRQRRGADQGDHRPVQQGAAAQARRLGLAARLGLGREPRPRLLRDRQGRRRQAGRDRGAVALRQGGARRDGLRPALRHRLHRLLGRGRGEAAPPQLRRAGREPHRFGRISLDGRELPQVRRPA